MKLHGDIRSDTNYFKSDAVNNLMNEAKLNIDHN
uniref:Uncharacterized protein n=1 Tax=mine drainage metagenome TaxID=410659 RepID=E6PTM6_9ZZZZ